jgi:hypothetical protein
MVHNGKLSAIEVSKVKGPAVLHKRGGLYLRVSTTGAKAWVFRFQLDGKRRDMGLDPSRYFARGGAPEGDSAQEATSLGRIDAPEPDVRNDCSCRHP